mgnify:CR=1 FL=1
MIPTQIPVLVVSPYIYETSFGMVSVKILPRQLFRIPVQIPQISLAAMIVSKLAICFKQLANIEIRLKMTMRFLMPNLLTSMIFEPIPEPIATPAIPMVEIN